MSNENAKITQWMACNKKFFRLLLHGMYGGKTEANLPAGVEIF